MDAVPALARWFHFMGAAGHSAIYF